MGVVDGKAEALTDEKLIRRPFDSTLKPSRRRRIEGKSRDIGCGPAPQITCPFVPIRIAFRPLQIVCPFVGRVFYTRIILISLIYPGNFWK